MNARIHPDRALTNAEKARRHRDRYAEYVQALELAVVDATWMAKPDPIWLSRHRDAIARARRSLATRQD